MPQLDFLNFFSQLFWLNFPSFVIYFLNVFFFLPIIFRNLRFREEFYLHILEEFSKESIKDLKFEFFSLVFERMAFEYVKWKCYACFC